MEEPADGGYVVVQGRSGVQVIHRDDSVAPRPDWRWMPLAAAGLNQDGALSWGELTAVGRIAYVGEFVDRSAD